MTKRVSCCRSFRTLSCSSLLRLSFSLQLLLLLLHKEQQHGVFVASATTSSSVLRRGASTIGKRTLQSGAKRAARGASSSLKQSVQVSAAAASTTGAAVTPSTVSTVQSNFIAHFPASLNQLPTAPIKKSNKKSLLSLLPKHLQQAHKHKTAATSKYLKSALRASQRPSTLATTSAVANSGFRQFSQRATRLQLNLQKSFSLRTIFGNCVTNNEWNHGEFNSDSHNANAVWRAPPLIRSLQGVVMETVSESVAGFVGGYLLAATTDVTRKVYRGVIKCAASTASASASTTSSSSSAAAAATMTAPSFITASSTTILPYPSITKYSQQVLQSHARSMTWAMEWARISAVFAACRLAVHLARNTAGRTHILTTSSTTTTTNNNNNNNNSKHNYFSNIHIQSIHHDEDWNDVLGSALVGAIFAARKNHVWKLRPAAMTKGALLYGGTMFLLHPDLWKEGMEALWLNLPKNAAGACYEHWYDQPWMMIN